MGPSAPSNEGLLVECPTGPLAASLIAIFRFQDFAHNLYAQSSRRSSYALITPLDYAEV